MFVCQEPDFRALASDISAIFAAAAEASFFAQAAWFDLVSRYARDRGDTVRVYCDAPCPAAALVCWTRGDARRLEGMSNSYALEYGPLVPHGSDAACEPVRRLVAEIARERPYRDALRFAALDPADAGYRAMIDGLSAARMVVRPFFDSGIFRAQQPAEAA